MHTLSLPRSVFSFELGPLRHLALCELAYLIKKTQVKARCQEAHRLRARKHFSPVDHLVRDCALERAKRARVRPLPSPTSAAPWITVCTSLLKSISNKEESFSKHPPSPR